ncbi:von Willebrand factor-like [Dendronephthya gigantea]|uniref:von Willebrand factor-like n=1 Tax=Dendronephthya gigantea TaxID=151771 RepID=UPI001069487E|nr:von Willebrand factor-like [Dendronephthya gigantea]
MVSHSLRILLIIAGFLVKKAYPDGTCSATGDPHYRTFDGRLFHYQGKCGYVLSEDIDNKFKVHSENDPCNGGRFTCTKAITVKVKGLTIHVARGGHVKVFGITVALPYNKQGVNIIKHGGRNIRISTDIGFTAQYDGVYNVFIILNDRYRGKTVGLCGNFNGQQNDEFIMPDKQLTNNDQTFADSWKLDRSCPNAPPLPNPCTTAAAHAQVAKAKCALMRSQPFSACHNHVNVDSGFIQDCEYDVCACKDHPLSCLCEEYSAYADSCSLVGVNVQWKNLPQFKECVSPCAVAPCMNGGICQNVGKGYKCTCAPGYHGDKCQTEVEAVCSATGDPHYRTFDGRRYNFMGQCQYILAKDLDSSFSVMTKNNRCNGRASCVVAVTVSVKGLTIEMKKGGSLTVFGANVQLPYKNQGVSIVRHGTRNLEITADIGIKVLYNGLSNLFVTVKGRHMKRMAGLCGNYNGNPNDEFVKVDMRRTNSVTEFGNSWKVGRSCPNEPPLQDPCLTAGKIAQEAKKKCQLLKQQPFAACHKSVAQNDGFIKDCEFDVCACNNHPTSCLCQEFSAYSTSCALVGVPITWKNLPQFAECSMPCASGPCNNGGLCINQGNDFKCECAPGYDGKQCEVRTCKDPKALGMEDGKIPNSRLKASSQWSQSWSPGHGRLHGGNCWIARSRDGNQWMQVDFKYKATVTEILTQGRSGASQWVKSYTVGYSDDGTTFKTYKGSNGQDKVFSANSDRNSVVRQEISPVVVARFIRIQPKTWHSYISMRVEFYGCFEDQPCSKDPCLHEGTCEHVGSDFMCTCLPGYYGKTCEQKECKESLRLGMENGEILDSQITASSEYASNHGADNARLNLRRPGHANAWVPRVASGSWIQVDFERQATISEVLTQGRGDHPQWVKAYTLSYSNNGLDFHPYRQNGLVKTFSANRDQNTIVPQKICPVIVTRYIRIHPTSWHGNVALRAGFNGCLRDFPCESKPCKNAGTCLSYHGDYRCSCAEGFAGRNCEMNIGQCVPN